jgi:DUF4097 and DUF4098 domain-containing protein YvlB
MRFIFQISVITLLFINISSASNSKKGDKNAQDVDLNELHKLDFSAAQDTMREIDAMFSERSTYEPAPNVVVLTPKERLAKLSPDLGMQSAQSAEPGLSSLPADPAVRAIDPASALTRFAGRAAAGQMLEQSASNFSSPQHFSINVIGGHLTIKVTDNAVREVKLTVINNHPSRDGVVKWRELSDANGQKINCTLDGGSIVLEVPNGLLRDLRAEVSGGALTVEGVSAQPGKRIAGDRFIRLIAEQSSAVNVSNLEIARGLKISAGMGRNGKPKAKTMISLKSIEGPIQAENIDGLLKAFDLSGDLLHHSNGGKVAIVKAALGSARIAGSASEVAFSAVDAAISIEADGAVALKSCSGPVASVLNRAGLISLTSSAIPANIRTIDGPVVIRQHEGDLSVRAAIAAIEVLEHKSGNIYATSTKGTINTHGHPFLPVKDTLTGPQSLECVKILSKRPFAPLLNTTVLF